MSVTLLVTIGIALSGCASVPVPVTEPCGVIHDSLLTVNAKDRDGNRRLADHFERGRVAGCWDAVGVSK